MLAEFECGKFIYGMISSAGFLNFFGFMTADLRQRQADHVDQCDTYSLIRFISTCVS